MGNNKKQILIAEDEKNLLEILTDEFTDAGFAVLQAGDGELGLKLALEQRPDFIIADILMPKLDGISMLKKIREAGVNVPSLVLTNLSDEESAAKAADLHTKEYLIKTDLEPRDVVAKVKDALMT